MKDATQKFDFRELHNSSTSWMSFHLDILQQQQYQQREQLQQQQQQQQMESL